MINLVNYMQFPGLKRTQGNVSVVSCCIEFMHGWGVGGGALHPVQDLEDYMLNTVLELNIGQR